MANEQGQHPLVLPAELQALMCQEEVLEVRTEEQNHGVIVDDLHFQIVDGKLIL